MGEHETVPRSSKVVSIPPSQSAQQTQDVVALDNENGQGNGMPQTQTTAEIFSENNVSKKERDILVSTGQPFGWHVFARRPQGSSVQTCNPIVTKLSCTSYFKHHELLNRCTRIIVTPTRRQCIHLKHCISTLKHIANITGFQPAGFVDRTCGLPITKTAHILLTHQPTHPPTHRHHPPNPILTAYSALSVA